MPATPSPIPSASSPAPSAPALTTSACRALFLPFIERAEQFAAACHGNSPQWALGILMPAFLLEMRTRFAHEERLLGAVSAGDSFAQAHAAQHQEMLEHLQALYQQRQHAPSAEVAALAGRYVQHHLLFHVGSADCELARRLMTLQPGEA